MSFLFEQSLRKPSPPKPSLSSLKYMPHKPATAPAAAYKQQTVSPRQRRFTSDHKQTPHKQVYTGIKPTEKYAVIETISEINNILLNHGHDFLSDSISALVQMNIKRLKEIHHVLALMEKNCIFIKLQQQFDIICKYPSIFLPAIEHFHANRHQRNFKFFFSNLFSLAAILKQINSLQWTCFFDLFYDQPIEQTQTNLSNLKYMFDIFYYYNKHEAIFAVFDMRLFKSPSQLNTLATEYRALAETKEGGNKIPLVNEIFRWLQNEKLLIATPTKNSLAILLTPPHTKRSRVLVPPQMNVTLPLTEIFQTIKLLSTLALEDLVADLSIIPERYVHHAKEITAEFKLEDRVMPLHNINHRDPRQLAKHFFNVLRAKALTNHDCMPVVCAVSPATAAATPTFNFTLS